MPECEFTASAYNEEFDRWDKGAPGTKINITGDTVITALWKYKVWKITFNANGGTGTMAPETVVVGNDYTLPECTFGIRCERFAEADGIYTDQEP